MATESNKNKKLIRKRNRTSFLIVSTLAFLGIIVSLLMIKNSSLESRPKLQGLLNVNSFDWYTGNKTANVILMEYSDFICQDCYRYYSYIEQARRDFMGKILFVFRQYPTKNRNSMLAAQAVEAAGQQNQFWSMYSLLFENQKVWSQLTDPRIVFGTYAKSISLNLNKFIIDFESAAVSGKIEADLQNGRILGIKNSPALFINGKSIVLKDYSSLRQGILRAMAGD
ncbi:DsbA family protein [Patescibacteria group bacterium]|nr:DsbA family protein [Patescibacteria group bacterium]